MNDKVRKKCRRTARKQFPAKGYEFIVFCLLPVSISFIDLVFLGNAHRQLSFLKLGQAQSAYRIGIQWRSSTYRRQSSVLFFCALTLLPRSRKPNTTTMFVANYGGGGRKKSGMITSACRIRNCHFWPPPRVHRGVLTPPPVYKGVCYV